MPAPTSVDDFLDLLRKSAVVEEKRLSTYLDQLSGQGPFPSEPQKFAGLMIRDGMLTYFQAEQLLQGRWKRFNIGRYRVLERLGSGGMGQVFLCEHVMMRRRVAIKVLPTAKAEDPSALERFQRESRAVAALDHPNIVRAYDIDQDDNLHFLVMEYVDGASLQDIVRKHGPIDLPRALHFLYQTAIGLQHAYEAGLVHRDIKPGNILIDRQGTVKILDMGLARFFNDDEDIITRRYDETVLGTADYLAPEQAIDSHTVDVRADIYSLGATFYYVLTGSPPFKEGTVAQKLIWHQTREPIPITQFRPEVPADLIAILEHMTRKSPGERYQIPEEVAASLEPWVRQIPFEAPPLTWMPQLCVAAMGREGNPASISGSRSMVTHRTPSPSTTRRATTPSTAGALVTPREPMPAASYAPSAAPPVMTSRNRPVATSHPPFPSQSAKSTTGAPTVLPQDPYTPRWEPPPPPAYPPPSGPAMPHFAPQTAPFQLSRPAGNGISIGLAILALALLLAGAVALAWFLGEDAQGESATPIEMPSSQTTFN